MVFPLLLLLGIAYAEEEDCTNNVSETLPSCMFPCFVRSECLYDRKYLCAPFTNPVRVCIASSCSERDQKDFLEIFYVECSKNTLTTQTSSGARKTETSNIPPTYFSMPDSTETSSTESTETPHLENGFDSKSATPSGLRSQGDRAFTIEPNSIITESNLPSTKTASSANDGLKPKFGKSEIVGTTVGGTCGFALAIAGVAFFLRRRKRRQKARLTAPGYWDPSHGLGEKPELYGSTPLEHHSELETEGEYGGNRATGFKGRGMANQSAQHFENVGEHRPTSYGTESYNPNRDTISTCSPVMSVISPAQQSPTVASPILHASTRPGSAIEERMTSPISELEGCLPEIYEK